MAFIGEQPEVTMPAGAKLPRPESASGEDRFQSTGTRDILAENLAGPEIPSLHGIRAVAVLGVIFGHVHTRFAVGGNYGVIAFFVLSGFLITHLLVKENQRHGTVSLRRFYIRRALRIFPAYYVFVVLYIVLHHFYGTPVSWPDMIACLTYTKNYWIAIFHPSNLQIGHTWSLAVEEQFYLLWPPIFLRFRNNMRFLMRALSAVILAVWIWRVLLCLVGQWNYIYCAFDTRMDALAVGCLIALAVHNGVKFRLLLRSWMIGPLLVGGIVAIALIGEFRYGRLDANSLVVFALLPLLCGSIIIHAIAFAKHPFYRCINNGVMRYLGIISYPLYLYHYVVVHPVAFLPAPLRLAAVLLLGVALASGSYFLIEKPCLRLKSRFSS